MLSKKDLEEIKDNLKYYEIAYVEEGGEELGDGTWCPGLIRQYHISAKDDINALIAEVERLTSVIEAMPNQQTQSAVPNFCDQRSGS